MTNNQYEMHGLLLGLNLVKDMDLSQIIILGDSLITIQYLCKGSSLNIILSIFSFKELLVPWIYSPSNPYFMYLDAKTWK